VHFDPNDPSTFALAPASRWRPRVVRGAEAACFFGLWYLLTMSRATGNTSWEQHSFGGPFIIAKEALAEKHALGDWIAGLLVLAFFLAFPVCWIIWGWRWAAIVALMLCVISIMLSRFAAMVASC
jgi:hypothetical protein